ncbi:hypothetical protein [Roseofilum capinflatum]|uniref:Uncharacterized protein n=1 Tax=Roseofilum capinflatum BLCC-M114 TaxID=3022440 RepID=A0ABT7B3C4_9CYAN|nr:hypothetical protein [Roseofilum capinflatum]MDJ1172793.1 hypothetical protein [Roseofilum capinflatum BLCC-M114]
MLPHEYTGKEFHPEIHQPHYHPPHTFDHNFNGGGDDDSWLQDLFEGVLSWFM